MQGSYLPLSSLQRNAAPGSELKATSTLAFFFFVLILLLGRFVTVVSGGVVSGGPEVSIVEGRSRRDRLGVAGGVDRADLEGVVPSASGVVGVWVSPGPEQAAKAPPSTAHSNVVGLSSLLEKVKVGVASEYGPTGPESIVVSAESCRR